MVSLPSLILGTQIIGSRVLQIWWQHNGLVPSLPGKLDAQIPRVQGNEGEFVIIGEEVLLSELVEAVDCIAEGPGTADMFPRKGGEAC